MITSLRVFAYLLAFAFLMPDPAIGVSEPVKLKAGISTFTLSPETMALSVSASSGDPFVLSEAVAGSVVSDLQTSAGGAAWNVPERRMAFMASVTTGGELEFSIRSDDPESSFTWPVQPLKREQAKALIWPRREGNYIPLDEPDWISNLRDDAVDTLEGLSTPFWGVETPSGMISCVFNTQFHNRISFEGDSSSPLKLSFSHTFRPGEPTTLTFRFRFNDTNHSPISPALGYRRWLMETGQFISMTDKIKKTPAVERLTGAAHVYLWGGGILTRFDLGRGKPNLLAKELVRAADAATSSPGKRIRGFLSTETWNAVRELASSGYKVAYAQTALADDISRALTREDFYSAQDWEGVKLSARSQSLLRSDEHSSSTASRIEQNCSLLFDAFPEWLPPVESWGGAFSTTLLDAFAAAGLERLRLCVDAWEPMAGHSDFARKAAEMGYLVGPYDSYHSIHDPAWKGTDKTWPTAQFDQKLYDTGAILKSDGTPRKGFKQRGFLLSPLVAKPYVESRTTAYYQQAPFNCYFFDCDGFGQVYDDFSTLHPATQMDDANARCHRMEWVSRQFGSVIGTEGGSAYAARAVHLFEGAFQDTFGWGDTEMSDKKSPYFTGGYYPPDAPAMFFKPAIVKPVHARHHFDPRFRLPLFEAVFHDSVVSAHHWSVPTLKFTDVKTTVILTELLYQVPPMYHMNPEEFSKRKAELVDYYKIFSPLHRETALLPLTSFEWLTPDRLVQKCVFGDKVEIVANFSMKPFQYKKSEVPPGAVCSVTPDATSVYKPNP